MPELLIEIGTEEIPARFLEPAIAYLGEKLPSLFADLRLNFSNLKVLATPRRIVFSADVENKQSDMETIKVGPSKDKAFDPNGKPTNAAIGFAKSQGVRVEDLIIVSQKKGDFVAVKKIEIGRKAKEVLEEALPAFILSIPFPKTMRWGSEKIRFARPIHWICAIFGSDTLNFSVGSIKSDNKSRGHRFLAPEPFEVKSLKQLEEELEKRFVILNQDRRKSLIVDAIKSIAEKEKAEPILTDELLTELNYLVEYPAIYEGSFDPKYLELPQEVLITVMHHHQRYIPLRSTKDGLLNKFAFISATPVKDPTNIIKGNERVLKARLEDAEYFFKADQKKRLKELAEKLSGVTFLEGIGSYADKVRRVDYISERIAKKVAPDILEKVKIAASICKSDLLTEMVGEFPELQGTMGRIYALIEGYDTQIAQAIEEHYKPRGADDEPPKTEVGAVLSISEKLDNIASCFALKLIPTGTKDPYALRRHALGIIRILLDKRYELKISDLIDIALDAIKQFHKEVNISAELTSELLEFMRARVFYYFTNKGFQSDVVEAVLSANFNALCDIQDRIEAVADFRKREDFENLAISFKRVVNIIPADHLAKSVDVNLLQMETEKKLWEKFNEITQKVEPKKQSRQYGEALKIILELKPNIDKFFDDVLVMTNDKSLRENRLNLLYHIASLYSTIADFKKLGSIAEKQNQGGSDG